MFSRLGSATFVPDGTPLQAALARTTHLGIGAHADDLEIMAIHGILACYEREDRWFSGVVVSDGAGSPQGPGALDAAELRGTRRREQERAATLGRYGAQVLLDFPSSSVKDARERAVVDDLSALLRTCRPEVLYTHALTDGHETHVAVALRVLAACRALPSDAQPVRVLGCEVWRDLDWLPAAHKVALPADEHPELQRQLLEVFESQLATKAFDRAALGRRAAHAAFSDSHRSDRHAGLVWAMDLTPVARGELEPLVFVQRLTRAFEDEVTGRLGRLG